MHPDVPFPLLCSGGTEANSVKYPMFGHPLRRVTDIILVLNCVMFAAQWLSKDAVTLLGMKVGGCCVWLLGWIMNGHVRAREWVRSAPAFSTVELVPVLPVSEHAFWLR